MSQRNRIIIGEADDTGPLFLEMLVLITTRLLITANSGGGKSWLLRRLAEQLFGKIQVIIIDPEGEFSTLREKYDYVLVGQGGETPADVRSAALLAEKLLELKASAVCDLFESFRSRPMDRRQWVRVFLNALLDAPRKLWHPLIVIVDEAHKFCPQETPRAASNVDREIISGCKEAMIGLATTGRKRGFCPVWATQRLAKLDKDASAEMFNRLVGMTIEDVDVDRAADLMSVSRDDKHAFRESLRTIQAGTFYAFGRAISTTRVRVRVGSVETTHPESGGAKHVEPPPTPDAIRALLPQFADLPKEVEEKARTMDDLRRQVRELQTQLKKAGRETASPAKEVKVADPSAIAAAVKKRDREWGSAVSVYRQAIMEKVGNLAAHVCTGARSLEFTPPPPPLTVENIRIAEKALAGPEARPAPRILTPDTVRLAEMALIHGGNRRPGFSPDRARNPTDGISPAQLRILSALAQFEAIGRGQVNKKWVAALANASHSSSTFGNNLGALRSAGYISYPAPGELALTDSGRQLAPHVDPPQSAEEMMGRCKQIVSPAQGRILDALAAAHPAQLAKDALADAAGASATSSTFGNNLGALRSAGMIDYPAPGMVKLAGWVVLEDQQ